MAADEPKWASGTGVAAVKLWDHIDRNPGCTLDDLVKMARDDMSIPIGARRMYAKHLSRLDRQRAQAGPRACALRHPRDVDENKAIRHVVVTKLRHMRLDGSIRQDEDGRYFTARPLRRTGIGALVKPPDDVRADIAERNALIAFRSYREKHPDGKSSMPAGLFRALSLWHDTVRRDYFAQQNGPTGAAHEA